MEKETQSRTDLGVRAVEASGSPVWPDCRSFHVDELGVRARDLLYSLFKGFRQLRRGLSGKVITRGVGRRKTVTYL